MRVFVLGMCAGCSLLWLQSRSLNNLEIAFVCFMLMLVGMVRSQPGGLHRIIDSTLDIAVGSTLDISLDRTFDRTFESTFQLLLLGLGAGVVWGNLNATWQLDSRIPLIEQNIEARVNGRICSLPSNEPNQVRFEFCVEDVNYSLAKFTNSFEDELSTDEIANNPLLIPRRLSLAWYHAEEQLEVGEYWHFSVRLKPPYGLKNPFGFDAERWSLVKGIDGYGYIIQGLKIAGAPSFSIDSSRSFVRDQLTIRLAQQSYSGWQFALLTGDRSHLDESAKTLLKETGTAHLLVISGLHIGLVFFWSMTIISMLWRQSATLCLWLPAEKVSLGIALIMSWCFVVFTGAELPTQRAAIAISLYVFSQSRLVYWSASKLFSITLLVLLFHEPLSVLSEGFWLTVFALAIILWFVTITRERRWYHWFYLQIVLSVLMASFSAMMFGGLSLNAWLANVLAVPLVSYVVLPIELLGLCLLWSPLISDTFFTLADIGLEVLANYLNWLQEFSPVQHINITEIQLWWVTMLILFILCRLRSNTLSVLMSVNLLIAWLVTYWPATHSYSISDSASLLRADSQRESANVYFLDVGQGLSVVIHNRGRWLVYDTAYGNGRFAVASSSLVPFLSRQGVSEIDMLFISHADKDHSGGAEVLKQQFRILRTVTGERPQHLFHEQGSLSDLDSSDFSLPEDEPCDENLSLLGDMTLRWLQTSMSGNDASCVLAIEIYGKRILLTGDIEKKAELALLRRHKELLAADVISVPHHGSNTSSSWSLVTQSMPKVAVVSSGYLNSFGHPSGTVQQRYFEVGSMLLTSWRSGMITIRVEPDKPLKINQYRYDSQKLWNHRSTSDIMGSAVVN